MYNIDLTPDFFDGPDDCYDFTDRPGNHSNHRNNYSNNTSDSPYSSHSINTDKSMSKTELAEQLGITRRTLQRWLNRIGEDNIPGYRKGNKILTPGVLKYLSEKLCF